MKTLLCILLLLVGLMPECYAQSGWILWEKIYNISTKSFSKDEWEPVQAYPSFEVCQRQVTVIAEREAKSTKDQIPEMNRDNTFLRIKGVVTGCEEKPNCVPNGYAVYAEIKGETFVIFHNFKCFPATFDPRK